MTVILTAAAIMAANDVQCVEVEVPEWGGVVLLQGAAENRDAYDGMVSKFENGKTIIDASNARAKLCAATVVNEEGERLFTEEDVIKLARKSSIALERVAIKAQQVLGLNKELEIKND